MKAANQAFPTCDKYKGKAMPEPPFGPAAFTSKLKMKRTPSIPVASINLLKDVDTSNPREAALALARSKTFQFSGFLRQVGTHDEIDSKDHQELDEYEGNPILPIRYQKDVAEICCGTTRRRFSKRRPWNTAFTWNKPFAYTDSKALISYEGCEKLCGNSYLKDTRERSNLSSGIMILLFFFCLYVSWRSVTYQTKPRICKDERDLATSVAVKNISLRSNKKLKTEVQGNTRKRKNTST